MDSSDGYIYILSSPSSHVKKIGFTQRKVTVRLKEWRKSCPSMDYKLQSWLMCRQVKKTERLAHRIFAKKRLARHTCIDCKKHHRELFLLPITNDACLSVILWANLLALSL
ncbi:hypothetical protein K435DRAFT_791286 [Dendrothele bispora CBS 962.96]|uniref:Bacteriophage T5 Orf172 DNA-binding domain-containing protein n=1 Tax=Dendrothele bispora (strain CBS 962.96) TaxID=1314807 RepID=A0A4S8MMI1_DENBC|nr:hypothetical protein K435DRAFT_791286 [Dendrothele bispora CBS 962.96]